MHFTRYDEYGQAYYTRTCSRGDDIYTFVRTFLAFYHYVLTLSARCSGVKKKGFNEKHQFYSFYPKIKAPSVENHVIYNFLSTDAIYQR